LQDGGAQKSAAVSRRRNGRRPFQRRSAQPAAEAPAGAAAGNRALATKNPGVGGTLGL